MSPYKEQFYINSAPVEFLFTLEYLKFQYLFIYVSTLANVEKIQILK